MVKAPQGLSLSAFTIISATTASRITRMLSTEINATVPAVLLISSRAIWPSDLPSRLTEKSRITKSCTHPAKTAPTSIQSVPGKIAELRSQHRPHQRPWPGDSGKVMTKDYPLIGADKIAAIFQALSRCGAHGVQRQHLGGDEL